MLNTILIIAVLYAIHTAVTALPTWLFVVAWVIFAVRAVQGLFSALVAILMLLGVMFFLKGEFAALFGIFSLENLLIVMGIMVVSGVGICAISTFFMVTRMVGYNRDIVYAY